MSKESCPSKPRPRTNPREFLEALRDYLSNLSNDFQFTVNGQPVEIGLDSKPTRFSLTFRHEDINSPPQKLRLQVTSTKVLLNEVLGCRSAQIQGPNGQSHTLDSMARSSIPLEPGMRITTNGDHGFDLHIAISNHPETNLPILVVQNAR